jgi:hypothetical protein
MITDGVSFIAEYPLVTNKPVIFWEKPEHWEFSPLGKIAKETANTVTSMDEVIQSIEQVIAGTLPAKQVEIEALIKAVRPTKTSAADAIVGLVLDDFGTSQG